MSRMAYLNIHLHLVSSSSDDDSSWIYIQLSTDLKLYQTTEGLPVFTVIRGDIVEDPDDRTPFCRDDVEHLILTASRPSLNRI